MKLVIFSVLVLSGLVANAACVDLSGSYSENLIINIEQNRCDSVSISGLEPGTGYSFMSGQDQKIDGKEYVYYTTFKQEALREPFNVFKGMRYGEPNMHSTLKFEGEKLSMTSYASYDLIKKTVTRKKTYEFSLDSNRDLILTVKSSDYAGRPTSRTTTVRRVR